MTCGSCNTWNPEEEHRCRRCGRRLRPYGSLDVEPGPVQLTATAPKLVTVPEPAASAVPVSPTPPAAPPRREAAVQASLFQTREPRKIVTISGEEEHISLPSRRRRVRPDRRAQEPLVEQQSFAFPVQPATEGRRHRTKVEAVIFCDSPVASPRHRVLAGAIDISLILVASALFAIAFSVLAPLPELSKSTLRFLIGAQLLLAIFYDVLFALAGSDTPGCVAVHLRALDFDGRKPAIRQRFLRLIGSYLSLMALGLGYIWMLLDEESLAWQDHISQTFLSPRM